MMKVALNIFLGLVMVSCATVTQEKIGDSSTDSTDRQPASAQVPHESRIQKNIVDKDLTCEGCILGSAHEGTFSSPLRVYQLVTPDLNLKNTQFDIPVVWNKDVAKWVKYFTGRGRDYFVRYSERAGRYAPVLSKILADNGLPRDLIYLAMAESGFQNHARSWASAVGPWQFMSYTGKKYGLNIDWFQDERRDPLKASVAAAGYLKDLYDLFGSWELATAGYNAGEGKMGRAIQRYGTRDFWKLTKGRYLKPETKNYVPKIMALAIVGKNLETFGFQDITFDHALDYEEINVPAKSDLYEVATTLGIEFDEIKRFNPELIRWQTPAMDQYPLRIPVGLKNKWESVEDKNTVVATKYQIHETQKASKLESVAQKYRLPANVLYELNPELTANVAAHTQIKLPFREDHAPYHEMYADLSAKKKKWFKSKRSYYRSHANANRSPASTKQFYVVKKGDTLIRIAQKTGVSVDRLLKSNSKLSRRRQINPGQKIAIR